MSKQTYKEKLKKEKESFFSYYKFTAMLSFEEGCLLSYLIDLSDFKAKGKDPNNIRLNYYPYPQKYLPNWNRSTLITTMNKLKNKGYVTQTGNSSNEIIIELNWSKIFKLREEYHLHLAQNEIPEEDSADINVTAAETDFTAAETDFTAAETDFTAADINVSQIIKNNNSTNKGSNTETPHGVLLEPNKNIIYSDSENATYKSVTAPRAWFRACRDKWGEELTVKKVDLLDKYLNKYPEQRRWILGRDLDAFINGLNEAYRVLNYAEKERPVEV